MNDTNQSPANNAGAASAKVYCGNGRVIKTSYGDLMKLSFSQEDVERMQGSLENGWVNVVVKQRREPSPTGLTHYLEVDSWKPSPQGQGQNQAPASGAAPAPKPAASAAAPTQEVSTDDLPF